MRPRDLLHLLAMSLTPAFALGADALVPTARITGVVLDARNGNGLPRVTVAAGARSTSTDIAGHFTFEPSAGAVHLELTADGYVSTALDLQLEPGAERTLKIELMPRVWVEERVDVIGSTSEAGDRNSTTAVRPSEVLQVAGALENVFRVLPMLPGVAPTDEASSRISVRGGGPDQNLTVMDGVEIHNPYRIWGLVSAFNPETVSGFELSTGAFSARYGDRLSSVLTVQNRAGSTTHKFTGSAGMSLTDGNVILEGRLPRESGSWLVTGRRTWYDAVAGRFTTNDLPSFGDLQGKAVVSLGGGRSLSVFGLVSREKSDIQATESDITGTLFSRTRNGLGALSLTLPLGSRSTSHTVVAGYENGDDFGLSGRYRNDLKRSNAQDDDGAFAYDELAATFGSTVRDFSLRQELQVLVGRGKTFELGGEVHDLDTRIDLRFEDGAANDNGVAAPSDPIKASRGDRRYGAWAIQKLSLGERVDLEAGLRFDRSELNGRNEFSPRLSGSLRLGANTRLRAAFGIHTQSPGYEKLAQSDYALDFSASGRLDLDNERARHIVLGLERTFTNGFSARIEGFHKRFEDLIVGRLETAEETSARIAQYDFPAEFQSSIPSAALITDDPVTGARGAAYGFDVLLSKPQQASARLAGWLAYTMTFADRQAYGRTFPFTYEQRHALALVSSLRLRQRLELSLTGRFATGFPRTAPVGLRVAATPDVLDGDGDGNRNELVPERDDQGLLVYAVDEGTLDNLDKARATFYARLDSRLTWTPTFGRGRLRLYLDVINVLARANGEPTLELAYQPGADRPAITEQPPEGFPFFPSFGIHYRF